MKEEQFIPLNISYLKKNYKDRTILYLIISLIIVLIGVCLTVKVHNDFFFIGFFASGFFVFLGVLVSLYFGLLFFRKVSLKENELMRIYKELIDHSTTTINDLWDIYAIEGNLVRYLDDSTRVFIKCEKGYVLGREDGHEEAHYKKLTKFINYISSRGYKIDYYNWHNNDTNARPLENLSILLKRNKNDKLKKIGQELIKECRELEHLEENSIVEYYVISSDNLADTAYIESVIEEAAKELEGSLYVDVRLCRDIEIVEAIQTIYNISGINLTELLVSQNDVTSYNVVRIIDILTNGEDDIEEDEEEHIKDYEEFMELLNQKPEQQRSENLIKSITKKITKKNNKIDDEELYGEDYEEVAPVLLDNDDDEELIDESEDEVVVKEFNNDKEFNKLKEEQLELNNKVKSAFNNLFDNDDNDELLNDDLDFDSLINDSSNSINSNSNDELLDSMFDDLIKEQEPEISKETKGTTEISNDDDEDIDAMFDDLFK